ncbi:MAG: patatin-like phospholipase family protein [Verrucomicrobiota bacterium]
MGGTSTGAIVAAILSWGASVETVEKLYIEQSHQVFGRANLLNRIWAKFEALALNRLLREFFSVDGQPVLLGTDRLRTHFLCVVRNATTGAPWIITNNPKAKYNDPSLPDNNLLIPLYQLIRASTPPLFFPTAAHLAWRGGTALHGRGHYAV